MKQILYIIGIFIALGLVSCEYDNYNAPEIVYSGQLTHNGQPFLYDGNPARSVLNFLQKDFGREDMGTRAYIGQDGSFTQKFFAGDYYLTLNNAVYPFEFEDFESQGAGLGYDTLQIELKSNVNKSFEITPYYEISDVTIAASGLDLVATFNVKKLAGTRLPAPAIVKARFYLSTSKIVNSATKCVGEAKLNLNEDGQVTVPLSVISYRSVYKNNFRDYGFARVALELEGVNDYYLFSDVHEVKGIPLEFNDVTEDYLMNYKQPFEVDSWFPQAPGRRAIVSNWSTTNDAVQFTMFDGWGDRLFMGAENWGGANPLIGGVYQTTTLPSGKYVFLVNRGWNHWDLNGGTDRAYIAITEGNVLDWNSNFIGKEDCGLPKNSQAMSINFELAKETTISLGYVVNLRGGEFNAVSFTSFKIIQID